MLTSEKTDELIPAFISARKEINPAKKSGYNKFHKYKFANEEDWHDAVMTHILSYNLVLSFSVTETINMEPRKTKNGGTEYVVEVHGTARLMHISGQWLEVSGTGQGQDGSDKSCYQAMTGMKKYLYALLFALPTTEQAEHDEREPDSNQQHNRDWTEGQKVAWFRDEIVKAESEKDITRLNKLGSEIPTKGFSPENQQVLLERAACALTSLDA